MLGGASGGGQGKVRRFEAAIFEADVFKPVHQDTLIFSLCNWYHETRRIVAGRATPVVLERRQGSTSAEVYSVDYLCSRT